MIRPKPFADIFKIAAVDEDGIYWHSSGAASFCWLAHPLNAEQMSGPSRHEIANRIGAAIADLDEGTTLQFIVANVPNVDWAIRDYLSRGGSSNQWLHQYEVMKAKAFKEWCNGMKDTVDADVTAKSIQVLIVLTVYQSSDDSAKELWRSVKDSLTPPEKNGSDPLKMLPAHKRAADEAFAIRETLLAKKRSFETTFQAIGMPRIRCDAENFIRFVRTQIHPLTGAQEPVRMDPELFLPEVICRQRIETAGKGKYVTSDGCHQMCLTADAYPEYVFAGMLSLCNDRLDKGLSPIDLLKDSVMCLNIRAVGEQEALAWIDVREKLSKGSGTDKNEGNSALQEVVGMRRWVRQDKRSLVDMCLSVKVNGKNEYHANERAKEVIRMFQMLDFHLRVEDTDALTIWAEQLPGGFNGRERDGGHRYRRKKDIVASALVPLFMSGRGTRTFQGMHFNPHYEPSAFNPFDNPRSFNAAYIAESGGGKSNRIATDMRDFLRKDSHRAFIIDYGGSFKDTVNLLGPTDGRDEPLSLTRKEPCNTFAGPMDTTIPMLLQWIPLLALEKDEELDPTLKALLEKALRSAYEGKLHRDCEFTKYGELSERFPGMFATNVRKRFAIHYLEPAQHQYVSDMLRGDEASRPHFELYFIIHLVSFRNTAGERVALRSIGDIDDEPLQLLRSDFAYIEQHDGGGVYILAKTTEVVVGLGRRGYECLVDDKEMMVEAQRLADFKQVIAAGGRAIYDPDFVEQKRQEIRERLSRRYGEDDPKIDEYISEDLQRINPDEFFESLVGLADMQEEIIFSDFIREAKRLNEPKLSDFVKRLGMWYGDGIYAEFFDRRGGVDLADYKVVNWDFKPIFPPLADRRFGMAMLGAVLTRIMVYCDSVLTMHERKAIIIDEFNQFRADLGDDIAKFVHRTTLQARKNGYCCWLGTQKFEHLDQVNLVPQFQHYLIGAQLPASLNTVQKVLDLTPDQMFVIAKAGMVPGRYSDFVLYVPAAGILEIQRSVMTPFEYWLSTTDPTERDFRRDKILKFTREYQYPLAEATILAAKECAEEFPRGKRVTEKVEI